MLRSGGRTLFVSLSDRTSSCPVQMVAMVTPHLQFTRNTSTEEIMNTQENSRQTDESISKAALSRRLEGISWGAVLIAVGTIWLLPDKQVPKGTWLIAAGLIILGFSLVRYFNALRVSGFSVAVGILATLAGLGEYFALHLPLFAIALIGLGTYLLFERLHEKDSVSTPERGWSCCWPGEQENDRSGAQGQTGGH
jgi:hypothetical protein